MTLESPVADDTAEQFAKGVQLHNEKDLTKPAVLEVITPTQVRLTISEGRFDDIVVDEDNKIVTTPAYMLAQNIAEAASGIDKLVSRVLVLAE